MLALVALGALLALRGLAFRTGAAPSGASVGELETLTKNELYERARAANIPGRSQMTKAELVRALRTST